MKTNFTGNIRELAGLVNSASEKKASFLQHILLLSVSALGILIALHQNGDELLFLRIVYVLAVALLALSIPMTTFLVYTLTNLTELGRQAYHTELIKATKEHREMEPVVVPMRKNFLYVEKTTYVLLFVSLFLLTLYAILSTLL